MFNGRFKCIACEPLMPLVQFENTVFCWGSPAVRT